MLIQLAPCSEVAQQSKARRKDDFLIAFSPVGIVFFEITGRTLSLNVQIIAEATATAYRGATNEVQQKLRRVIEVWRQRQIFELPIQEAIEARIDGKPLANNLQPPLVTDLSQRWTSPVPQERSLCWVALSSRARPVQQRRPSCSR